MNTSIYLIAAEYLSRSFLALLGLCMVRMLDVREFGQFSAAFSFAQIVAIGVDAGMGQLVARNLARKSDCDATDGIFTWRILLVAAASLAAPLLSMVFLPPSSGRMIALWLIPSVLLMGMTDFFTWILKGLKRFSACATLLVASRALLLILGGAALLATHRAGFLLAAFALSGIAGAAVSFAYVVTAAKKLALVRLRAPFFKGILPEMYHFGIVTILCVMFNNADILLVNRLCGDMQAGFYSSSMRVLDILRLLPFAAYGVFIPYFSSIAHDPSEIRAALLPLLRGFFVLALGISVTGFFFSRPLIVTVFGAHYGESSMYLQPLLLSAIPMFANQIIFAVLLSRNRLATLTAAVVSGLAVNIGLNAALLPVFGPLAASWNRVAAELVIFGIQAACLFRSGLADPSTIIVKPLSLLAAVFAGMHAVPAGSTAARIVFVCVAVFAVAVATGLIPVGSAGGKPAKTYVRE